MRKLELIIERVIDLRDKANDDEFRDELDNALLALEAASDRLVAIAEDEDYEEDHEEE